MAGVVASTAALLAVAGCAIPTLIAPGPETSTVGHPSATGAPSHVVVALGDSVVSGDGCDCTYLSEYAEGLGAEEKTSVHTVNFGLSGITAAALAESLATDEDMRTAVGGADIVLITVGANDLWEVHDTFVDEGSCDQQCYQPSVDTMAGSVERVLEEVRGLTRNSGAQVLVTNYWNVFEAGETAREGYGDAFLGWTDEVTLAANKAICDASRRNGVACVDVDAAFVAQGADPTPLLADDGDHPNAAGTAVIAKALLAATTWHVGASANLSWRSGRPGRP